ncbi:MAG: hypothetical protein KAX37_00710 [Opitutaceae bacterium]|mgnify:CR=1 FL=1|jgi:hypothetical protein|nr:hypothetical protein [Opitutaceae bacterium]
MSAEIHSDLVEVSSFVDVHRIEVFRDLVVLYYPRHTKYLTGPRVHALAPLLALGEPIPASIGPVRPSTWTGSSSIEVRRAGSYPAPKLPDVQLRRPLHLPTGTSFFLLDGADFKHLVRLTEFCRLAFDARGKACLVFNDVAYVIEPVKGAVSSFKSDVIARFPKAKAGCAAGEMSGMSVWPDVAFALAAMTAHFGVKKISLIPPLSAVADPSWSWVGPLITPTPHSAGTDIGVSFP